MSHLLEATTAVRRQRGEKVPLTARRSRCGGVWARGPYRGCEEMAEAQWPKASPRAAGPQNYRQELPGQARGHPMARSLRKSAHLTYDFKKANWQR